MSRTRPSDKAGLPLPDGTLVINGTASGLITAPASIGGGIVPGHYYLAGIYMTAAGQDAADFGDTTAHVEVNGVTVSGSALTILRTDPDFSVARAEFLQDDADELQGGEGVNLRLDTVSGATFVAISAVFKRFY